jgi:ComF family protein
MHILDKIISILFPTKCIGCRKEGADICNACISKIEGPQIHKEDWIYSCFSYKNPTIRRALRLYKFSGRKSLKGIFAHMIYEEILAQTHDDYSLSSDEKFILIPVPLTKKRQRERGYNQSLMLAKELVAKDPDIFTLSEKVVMKTKDTERQAMIQNRSERLRNLKNAFAISTENKDNIKGRIVIIVDDITTTGATLSEIRKVLLQAKPRKVLGFTVAH